ncbi:MAG TPA: hypothetical protein EYQ14_30220 [Gammaproteobacteria bacterium]|nr:hypothetical protein [Gammaproteobacteria bacterium]
MIWVTFTFLLSLASVESGLAYMREILAEQKSAVTASLIANGSQVVVDNSMRWITTAAQMGLGFILPFSLVLVAIPLESFIESFRTVMGVITVAVLRTLAVAFRVIGNVAQYTSRALIHAYDMIIFVPLWVEGLFFRRKGGRSGTQPAYDGS